MKYLIKSFLIVLIFFSHTLFAQNKPAKPRELSASQSLKMADYLYGLGSYYNALDYYLKTYDKESDNNYVVDRIATCEYYLRDYKSAEKYYHILKDAKSDQYPMADYYYALMLKYNAKYTDAKNEFAIVEKTAKGTTAGNIKKLAKNQAKGCDMAIEMIAHPDTVRVKHLDSKVNAPYSEESPLPVGEDLLLYASLKSDTVPTIQDNAKNNQFVQFYSSKLDNDSTFEQSQIYTDMPINESGAHTGNGCFSPDKTRFYFVKAKTDAHMKFHSDIYLTELKNGKWSNPVKLPKEVNDPDSTNTQPSVGISKNGEVLYFASNRAQGEGGMDIWYCVRNKDGSYSNATNLGRKINTSGNEITPYYDTKNQTLYFSSDGWPGMGGYDIFKAKGGLKRWEPVKNMGYPINSSCDDMYYILDDNRYSGYFVSNRPGIISVKTETCCDDIFRFYFPKIYYTAVRGYVFDDKTKKQIPGAKVVMVTKDTIWGTPEMSSVDTMYFWDTKALHSYTLKAEKNGYFANGASFSVEKKSYNDTMRVDIYLKPIPPVIIVKNIYYGFDSANIRPTSIPALDSLRQLLVDNPTIKIEIRSHTDSMGSYKYNQTLSQARAQSVVDYLVGKGIDKDRLVATGMGAIEPIAPNKIHGKDNPAGRQLNRRTDFKVIGTIPGKEIQYKQGDTGFDDTDVDTLDEQKQQEKQQQQQETQPQKQAPKPKQ